MDNCILGEFFLVPRERFISELPISIATKKVSMTTKKSRLHSCNCTCKRGNHDLNLMVLKLNELQLNSD
jgi:hypothetical protein